MQLFNYYYYQYIDEDGTCQKEWFTTHKQAQKALEKFCRKVEKQEAKCAKLRQQIMDGVITEWQAMDKGLDAPIEIDGQVYLYTCCPSKKGILEMLKRGAK
jgi:hypothetical protein